MRTMLRAENQYIFVAIDFKRTGSFSTRKSQRIGYVRNKDVFHAFLATVPTKIADFYVNLWKQRPRNPYQSTKALQETRIHNVKRIEYEHIF